MKETENLLKKCVPPVTTGKKMRKTYIAKLERKYWVHLSGKWRLWGQISVETAGDWWNKAKRESKVYEDIPGRLFTPWLRTEEGWQLRPSFTCQRIRTHTKFCPPFIAFSILALMYLGYDTLMENDELKDRDGNGTKWKHVRLGIGWNSIRKFM
jgi:hypothetical protein